MRKVKGAATCLALLFALGCKPEPLTKAQYISEADRVCARFEREAREVEPQTDPFREGAGPEEIEAGKAFLGYFSGQLRRLAGTLRAIGSPPQDRKDLQKALRGLKESANTFGRAEQAYAEGDMERTKVLVGEAFGRLEQAGLAAQQYGFKQCGATSLVSPAGLPVPPGPEIPVVAREYAFEIPPEIGAGPHTFVVRNDGKERHFLALVKLKEGASAQELLEAQQSARPDKQLVEVDKGQSPTALPGQTVRFNADLPPGNYAYACFVAAPDGQLHAAKGMFGQFSARQP